MALGAGQSFKMASASRLYVVSAIKVIFFVCVIDRSVGRGFLLDDSDTQISGVFCSGPPWVSKLCFYN